MATKKQEDQINKLYELIKTLGEKMTKEDIEETNIKGFLYSCGRLNVLQISAYLAIKAKKYGFEDYEILQRLGD